MNRWLAWGTAGVVLAVAVGATALHRRSASGGVEVVPRGNFSLEQSRRFTAFPIYYAGDAVQGHALAAVQRRRSPPSSPDLGRGTNFLGFSYGRCRIEAPVEGGCQLPLQILNIPSCMAVRHSYGAPGQPLPSEDTTVRGAPATFYEDGARLEVYLDRVTVYLAGQDRGLLLAAARRLVPVAGGAITDPLPPVRAPGRLLPDGVTCG